MRHRPIGVGVQGLADAFILLGMPLDSPQVGGSDKFMYSFKDWEVLTARRSNMRHRPIGLGVQGLADALILLGMPFDSSQGDWLVAPTCAIAPLAWACRAWQMRLFCWACPLTRHRYVVHTMSGTVVQRTQGFWMACCSNMRHRPIGLGVQGAADAFILLGMPFDSPQVCGTYNVWYKEHRGVERPAAPTCAITPSAWGCKAWQTRSYFLACPSTRLSKGFGLVYMPSPIGLGVQGLTGAFILLGMPFDSPQVGSG
ncbi:unnamed protein product [Closterium sp. NIES-54]